MVKKGKEGKPHIGIFGRRNNGKSSLINFLSGQETTIVSDIPGTTTDPVNKSIEIPGLGPVVLTDTAGIDDSGELGKKRVEKTIQTIAGIDAAILVLSDNIFDVYERSLIERFHEWAVPFMLVHNKSDICQLDEHLAQKLISGYGCPVVGFSCHTSISTEPVISELKRIIPENAYRFNTLIGDLLTQGDTVLLITPVDTEAPEGRLILPQVQVIRDILDNDCIAVVAKEREIDTLLKRLSPKPVLAITDSQVFLKADASVPKDIPLTSFSIVLARYKGDFENYLLGTPVIDKLKDGDRILIMESCAHHVSCDDIGRVKIPRWLSNYSGKKLNFDVVSGMDIPPRKYTDYQLAIQCGGCMMTPRQLRGRIKPLVDVGVPVTNYGMTIAWVHGIYKRAVAPFVKISSNLADYL